MVLVIVVPEATQFGIRPALDEAYVQGETAHEVGRGSDAPHELLDLVVHVDLLQLPDHEEACTAEKDSSRTATELEIHVRNTDPTVLVYPPFLLIQEIVHSFRMTHEPSISGIV